MNKNISYQLQRRVQIPVKLGDVIRFTSIVSERKDIKNDAKKLLEILEILSN